MQKINEIKLFVGICICKISFFSKYDKFDVNGITLNSYEKNSAIGIYKFIRFYDLC